MENEQVMQIKKVWFECEDDDGTSFMLLAGTKELEEFIEAMDALKAEDSAPAQCH
ncbi:MAG: hypothetical protein M0R70_14705 [Nitrospirae bacterium]|nr:hypothetical protein [Nitrospirota bacterium]